MILFATYFNFLIPFVTPWVLVFIGSSFGTGRRSIRRFRCAITAVVSAHTCRF